MALLLLWNLQSRISIKNNMDLATLIPTITALVIAIGALYVSVSEQSRKNQEKEDARVDALTKGLQKQLDDALKRIDVLEEGKQKRDDQIAQLRDERAKDVLDYSKMTAEVTELLQANQRLAQRQQDSDKQIATLTKNMETLSAESVKKDEVIHQQGEQIATLQTENKELKQRVKLLETAMEAANVPIPNGEDEA